MSSTPSTGGMSLRRSSKRKAAQRPLPVEVPSTAPADDPTASKLKRIRRDPQQPQGRKEKKTPSSKKKMSAPKRHLTAEEEDEVDADGSTEGAADEIEEEEERSEGVAATGAEMPASPKQRTGVAAARASKDKRNDEEEEDDACFLGDPVPEDESRERWPHRYVQKDAGRGSSSRKEDDDTAVKAKCHYLQARVDGCVYYLNDGVYVNAGEGVPHYIGRILEFFETADHELYFTAQWFFRTEDTVIKEHARFHDKRRVFLSDEKNDNALNCIVRKVRILHVPPMVGAPVNEEEMADFELYYDMAFSVAYSSFTCLPFAAGTDLGSISCGPSNVSEDTTSSVINGSNPDSEGSTSGQKSELLLLDLFSGCGAMSTGLCLGANLAGVNLKTRWAVDMNCHACDSLRHNHPETEVRNEKAEDFLNVIREWEKLCQRYCGEDESPHSSMDCSNDEEECKKQSKVEEQSEGEDESEGSDEDFVVKEIIGICYGKTEKLEKVGLKFKVSWDGYDSSEDSWEPADGLSNCQEKIKDFVRRGYENRILPLPGTTDVICGGPPCQGMSGFNRFREKEDPFKDEKNKQMSVFMQIIDFLKPRFVLMENVVDILRFAGGYLGRFALSELVRMKYQARLGILAAGNYGLPQYRMRVFLWGAHPTQKLPQFPLPTHEVVTRGAPPVEFEGNVVAYDGGRHKQLEKALLLSDAISDLPPVRNDESRDEMNYGGPPTTDFQCYIRLSREQVMHPSSTVDKPSQDKKLFDHRPLRLNDDDYERVCRIPKKKGANFRDLPGVMVGPDNAAQWDPNVPRVFLKSGKPLVPDYAMSFIKGKSLKPFGRLWWDQTVPTVVTRAEPHNQVIIHPEQDRVLSIRENARLQGFPDYYKLFGPLKQRYIQVGNAVAVPVSRALGYAFGVACLGKADEEPAIVLPQKFPINL